MKIVIPYLLRTIIIILISNIDRIMNIVNCHEKIEYRDKRKKKNSRLDDGSS